MATASLKHFGICVADVERSSRFYTEALGFEPLMDTMEIGPPFDTLIEQPGARIQLQQLRCGDVTIELLGFPGTGVTGEAQRRPMNQLGFTHLTLEVDDIDAVAERIREFGGDAHPGTRIDSPFGPLMFCSDPDGVRIELMQPAPH